MKIISTYLSALFLLVVCITSCADKKEAAKKEDPKDNIAEILAGTTSKTWHISKQINAEGDTGVVTPAEKNETLNLYQDGRFSITQAQETTTGTWSTEGNHTFMMYFEDKDVTKSFSILDLSKGKVVLKTAEGNETVLEEY